MDYPALLGYDFNELKTGMEAVMSRTVTETDVRMFSGVSGDTNPMHLSEEFASHTPFKRCIVHGMLSASLISAVVGTKLPGPGVIYLKQSLKFIAPVYVGDTVYAVAQVRELMPEKRHVLLETRCEVNHKVVVSGEALVKIPERG